MKKLYNCMVSSLMLLCLSFVVAACSDDDDELNLKYPVPTISEFTPSEGLPSSVVTIKGTEFGNERTERIGRVYFGGVEATEYVSWSDTEIQVRVPEGGVTGNITLWVWKNHVETTSEFTCIPGAEVKSITPSEAYPGSEITLVGINFGTFINMPLEEIQVEFLTAEGSEKVSANSLTETELKVTVPTTAKSGVLKVYFGDRQTITTPELTLVGDYTFALTEYLEKGGTITIEEGGIGSTKDDSWVIYEFKAPATGFFEVITQTATTKDGSYLNIDVNDNLNTLKTQAVNESLTQTMPNSGSWSTGEELTYGVFHLEAGKTYYMKLTFLQDGTTWVGNINGLKISLAADQTAASGEVSFVLQEYVETGGTITIDDGGIGSTKNGGWVIYQFSTPRGGLYDVHTMTATTKDGSSLNVDINSDLNTLKAQSVNEQLTQTMPNTGDWVTDKPLTFGSFYLDANKTYYLKLTFLQEGTTWVGNLHEVKVIFSADQTATPVNGAAGSARDYVLYENNFNSGTSYSPFTAAWAWEPNYIEVKEQCLEFYYNYKALLEDNRRMRRGCEITCDFETPKEGWYGFKVYLPEGKFPMNEDGIIITQIFNQGCKNSWAGHLKFDSGELIFSHRHALVDPVEASLGKFETNKWYPVVLHFKVGRNNKGRLQAWVGDDMAEGTPTYDSGACNFGFGHWIDDDTLDDTGTNQECLQNNPDYGGNDKIGCKFGLYVQNQVDITIRFDDIKALEGNPAGAFDIVKP